MASFRCLACILLAAAMAVGPAAAAPPQSDFAALVKRARKLAKDPQTGAADRAAVLAELAEHATPEAATVIATVGLTAADAPTRIAAREQLVGLSADPTVRARLLADYRRQSKHPGPLTAELALVLLAAEADDESGQFRTLVEDTPRPALLAWTAAVCDAASRGCDATALSALRTLASLRCCADSLAFRRGLVATLAGMTDPRAVEALIDMLEGLRGEARGDAIQHLTKLSGENHGTDVEAWRIWFAVHRDAARRTPPPEADPAAAPAPRAGATRSQADYYDIPIHADRVVFVLDTSGSMQGPRLEAAKRELQSAIFGLPAETLFTVVFFNSDVGSWQRALVPATDDTKRAAATFVARLPADGGTATSDALQAAFTFDTEAIFILSDGAPSAGRVVEPAGIIQFVTQLNQGRAVTVNAISIMGGGGFLENLARANHGSFREVAE
jgi:Mg-chelatase subunit ChlD